MTEQAPPPPPPTHVTLSVDGREVTVPRGTLVIDAARQAGIYVPFFCSHPKLKPLGACRMCLVEIEKMPKQQVCCTVPAAEGMVVRTDTPAVLKSRSGQLEFLLLNHPLDCPVCDRGGECDLQDHTIAHGPARSRLTMPKVHYRKAVPLGPTVMLDEERCIVCQRCVRFTTEIAGDAALQLIDRGVRTVIGTYQDRPYESQFSGNVVEICPVGALTSRPYRFKGRPWELKPVASVCPHCSVGCNITADVRLGRIQRFRSRCNDHTDRGWLCDRGRYGHDVMQNEDRLRQPLRRRGPRVDVGALEPVLWDEAIDEAVGRLHDVVHRFGAKAVAGVGSTRTTNEDSYTFQKFMRAVIGSNHLDHQRAAVQLDDSGVPLGAGMALPLEDVCGADWLVLAQADPSTHQPVVELWLRRAIADFGARLVVLSPHPTALDGLADHVVRHDDPAALLRSWSTAWGRDGKAAGDRDRAGQALAGLRGAQRGLLLTDEWSLRGEAGAAWLKALLDFLSASQALGRGGEAAAALHVLPHDSNSLGAKDMGVLPHLLPGYRAVTDAGARVALASAWERELPDWEGRDLSAIWEGCRSGEIKALVIMGANPLRQPDPSGAIDQALGGLELLVVLEANMTPTAELADVVLPVAAFGEKAGTVTNLERRVQRVQRVRQPAPGLRPDWQVLEEMGRRYLLLEGVSEAPAFSHAVVEEVFAEISSTTPLYAGMSNAALGAEGRRWEWPPTAMADAPPAQGEEVSPLPAMPTHDDRFAHDSVRPSGRQLARDQGRESR